MDDMTKKQKLEHVKRLWKLMINMQVVAFKTVRMYQEVAKDYVVYTDGDFSRCTNAQKLKMFGTTEDIEHKEKPKYTTNVKWFILTPSKRFFMIWNIIVVCLL